MSAPPPCTTRHTADHQSERPATPTFFSTAVLTGILRLLADRLMKVIAVRQVCELGHKKHGHRTCILGYPLRQLGLTFGFRTRTSFALCREEVHHSLLIIDIPDKHTSAGTGHHPSKGRRESDVRASGLG